jgi:hypothetical protein
MASKILTVEFVVLVVMDQMIKINIDVCITAEVKDTELVIVVHSPIIKLVFVLDHQSQNHNFDNFPAHL